MICINDSLLRVARNIKLFAPNMILMVPLMIETLAKKLEDAAGLPPEIVKKEVIGVLSDYPPTDTKTPAHIYCAFTSGIIGTGEKVRLYSGLGDAHEGWVEIPDPFRGYR